jgi:fluoride ion exporter CrcB/FEX
MLAFAVYNLVSVALSLGGFVYGRFIGRTLCRKNLVKRASADNLTYDIRRTPWGEFSVGALCWQCGALTLLVVFAVLSGVNQPFYVFYSPLLGSMGVLLRWGLSFLNKKYPKLPLGTLLANVLGSFIIGFLYLSQSGYGPLDRTNSNCHLLKATMVGFCGKACFAFLMNK